MKFRIILMALAGMLMPVSANTMEPGLQEPSPKTRAAVEKALKAFEIPAESVKIFGFRDNSDTGGWANSDRKIIAMAEDIDCPHFLTYASFHEAAHIKDEATRKGPLYANYFYQTAALTSALGISAPFLGKAIKAKTMSSFFYHAAIFSTLFQITNFSFWLSNFYSNVARPWSSEQAEYRADKMACEKLIALGAIAPIVSHLARLKLKEKYEGYARTNDHPPARLEFNNVKRTLKKHGYDVFVKDSKERSAELYIAVIKDDKAYRAHVEAEGYNSKV